MTLTDILSQYARECYSITNKARSKSDEAYFGADNPLKSRLISQIEITRARCEDILKKNPNTKNFELIKQLQPETDKISNIIEDELNIEGCCIGYTPRRNCAARSTIFNSNIAGTSESANSLRVRLDDIIETKNGYKYKDKTGIWYCIIIGLPLIQFKDEFTSAEVAALILHELGHCTEHIVNDLNTAAMRNYYKGLLEGTIHASPKNNTKQLLKLANKKYDDPAVVTRIGQNVLNNTEVYEYVTINEINKNDFVGSYIALQDTDSKGNITYKKGDLITENNVDSLIGQSIKVWVNDYSINTTTKVTLEEADNFESNVNKNYVPRSLQKQPGFFKRLWMSILKSIAGILGVVFIIPLVIKYNISSKNKTNSRFKVFEETADTFATSYGLGVELASAIRKMEKFSTNPASDFEVINKIPMLDLINSARDMREDYLCAVAGYPSDQQRVVNTYETCKFELDNNKGLSATSRKELQDQLDDLKDLYDNYVNDYKSSKGVLYRMMSGCCRRSIEEAASKDKGIEERVLKPLLEKSNASNS